MQELMKKIIYAIAALALIFTGCAKELDNSTKDNFSKVRLHVKVADQLTKVSADNDGRYHWQAGDKITVLNSNGNANEFSTVDGGASVNFSTDSFDGDAIGKYAMYPASAGHVEVEDVIGFNLPSSYIWKANSTNMPMLAKIVGDEATFKAVGGVLKLVCYNIPANAVLMEFAATSKQISGEFEIPDGTVETPVITTADKESSNNIVNFDFTGNRDDNMVFYIPLPTGEINGFTVTFYSDAPAALFTKTTTKTLVVERNQMIVAPDLVCADIVLWSEDFSEFSTGLHTGLGYGGADITYSTNDSGTKTYNEENAQGTKPELLIKASKYFKVEGIPTLGKSKIVLKYKTNAKTLNLSTTTEGVSFSPTSSSAKAEHTSTITNSKGASTIDIIFTAGGDNVRIDDISVLIAGVSAFSSGPEAGTILFSETFDSADDGSSALVYYSSSSSTAAYDSDDYGGTITYTRSNSSNVSLESNNTAGGTANQIMINKNGGSLTIAGIKTYGARRVHVSFKYICGKSTAPITSTCGSTNSGDFNSTSASTASFDATVSGESFSLVIRKTSTDKSTAARFDDIQISVIE